jgi:apolipoprotein D and lipocalin family protein
MQSRLLQIVKIVSGVSLKYRFWFLIQRSIGVAFCAVLSLSAAISSATEVKVVEKVDLARYQGAWHEIASIPQFFQRKCVRDTIATYSQLEGGEIKVENTCTREDGGKERAEGRARLYDSAETAKLSVTFLQLFGAFRYWAGGDYWVIELDPNYQWAVVGHPSRKYGWLLSRTPTQPVATLAEIIGRIKAQGYDACEFIVTPQTGGLTIKRPLCNAIQ